MSETGSISVSELNYLLAEAVRREPRIRSVTVRGEVSGFRPHLATGHWYFSLKDEESAISCVMFRQNTFHAQIKPRDGDRILVSGFADVYTKNGQCQLRAMSLRPDGTGDLFLRFEELKRRLSAEGLFDPSRKKLLPMVPRKVAVVTSGSGAAWHDILNVSALRNPTVPIVLIPVTVQGDRAAAEIAAGIRIANEQTDADVVIVARGGGSAEDLWCFNDENVARAVAGSRIPVVSGVGHEIDTTICDLAADVRASTPSNAAEIVFPDRKELSGNFCRSCGYCLPCTVDIDIPQAARMAMLLRRSPYKRFMSNEWHAKMQKIEECVHCDLCKSRCPYGLDTPSLLQYMLKDYNEFYAEHHND